MPIPLNHSGAGVITLKAPTSGTLTLTLPTADGTNGQVLSTNGSGVLSFATAGGGGGVTGFTSAENTTAPNATVYVDSLTASAASTNADVAFVAKGTGATLAQVPDSTITGGNKRGTYATDWQKTRNDATQVASGNYSALIGGDGNTASGAYSFVGGGSANTASGSSSVVIGTSTGTATNTRSVVIGGDNNSATGFSGIVLGGNYNTASGVYSAVLGGGDCIAAGQNSAVIAGYFNKSNAEASVVTGGSNGIARLIKANIVNPSLAPISATDGGSQAALLILGRQTTNATATVLASNSSAAGTTNQVILPNNSAYFFRGEVIAGKTAAGDTKGWTVEGVIKRGANAASTALVGTPTVTSLYADTGAATWAITATADTTNGGLAITVTGQAATTIRWVAQIRTTEMTY